MNKEQLDKFKAWFDGFVGRFYSDDEYINANIKLKQDHSKRVCEETLFLADELSLDENKRLLAETIALLHDVGRFPQFAKYQTYHDPRSVNHCLLAVSVLKEHRVLDVLEPAERQIILDAIEYHGLKELPARLKARSRSPRGVAEGLRRKNLDEDTLLFCRLIRDADKLDIYRVVIQAYTQQREDPDNFKFEMELPDEPRCSPGIIQAILNGEHIDYAKLQTWNDMKLINLAWVYDVNFIPTLKRIKERKALETIIDLLPDTPDIRKVRDKVLSYVDSRIK
ncbi:MAG: HD domain-containing protein [Planctomycetota bacterium]